MEDSRRNSGNSQRSVSDEIRAMLTRLLLVASFGWCLLVGAIYLERNPQVIERIFPTKPPPTATPFGWAPLTATPITTPELTATPEPTATPTPTTKPTPTYTPKPIATATPSPTPLPPGCLNSTYKADVTVPDNTCFDQGESFVKTWRVRNTGTCPWPEGTILIFVKGDALDAPDSVNVGALEIGETMDISVEMTAPATDGRYKGTWRLAESNGQPFGTILTVVIRVGVEPADPSL